MDGRHSEQVVGIPHTCDTLRPSATRKGPHTMFMVDHADIVAIKRTFEAGGRDAALADLRRRYKALTDKTAPAVLDRLLGMSATILPFRQTETK